MLGDEWNRMQLILYFMHVLHTGVDKGLQIGADAAFAVLWGISASRSLCAKCSYLSLSD